MGELTGMGDVGSGGDGVDVTSSPTSRASSISVEESTAVRKAASPASSSELSCIVVTKPDAEADARRTSVDVTMGDCRAGLTSH